MQGPGLDSRVDLSGLGFVVFARDRPRHTSELIAYLAQGARGFVVDVFDNGEVPLDLRLGPELMASVHHSYSMGGFVSQHGEAAREVDTEFVMLLDDDSLPAVHGIAVAISALRCDAELQAAHGTVGTYSTLGPVRLHETVSSNEEDVSALSSDREERLMNQFDRPYQHRYWYAVHRRQRFSDIFTALKVVKVVDSWHSTTELVLEAMTVWDGPAIDIGQVTCWDNVENASHYKEWSSYAISPADYWLKLRYWRARNTTFFALQQVCGWRHHERRLFARAVRTYARQYRIPVRTRIWQKCIAHSWRRISQRRIHGLAPLLTGLRSFARRAPAPAPSISQTVSDDYCLEILLRGEDADDIRELLEFLSGHPL